MENDIFSALSRYGFTPVNDAVCVGTWRNYAVTLQKFGGKTYYVYLAIRLQKVPGGLKKTLNAAVKEPGLKLGGVERIMPNFVQYSFSFAKAEDPAARFAERMDVLTAALVQNGVAPANTCAVTGAYNPDSLCFIPRSDCFGYQPVCASAVRQQGYTVQEKAEQNENNGSYLTGLVGAILGMLVGVAVNLLTMVFMERIFALLFALVPVAAMFGYKLFKGKTDKLAVVIVVVLSILAIPLMEYLTGAIAIVREYGAPFGEALRNVGEVFFEPYVLEETGPEMLKMLFFMALGVFIAWSYLRGQINSTQVKGAQLQLDTMRPNPLYQGGQQQ